VDAWLADRLAASRAGPASEFGILWGARVCFPGSWRPGDQPLALCMSEKAVLVAHVDPDLFRLACRVRLRAVRVDVQPRVAGRAVEWSRLLVRHRVINSHEKVRPTAGFS
jgi:hypothetical protein